MTMTPDDQLNSLLKQCKDIEPSPGFEGAVWNKLHTAQPLPFSAWRSWMTPLAVAAGLMIGIGVGVMFPAGDRSGTVNGAIFRNGSLTGAYMALSSGGDQ